MGDVPKAVACGSCFTSWAALSRISGRGGTSPLRDLKCQGGGGSPTHSEEKGRQHRERIVEGCDQKGL